MMLAGLGLLIVGFGFKVAVVPFHMWTPDVYQGAPTPVTAFFSVGPKAVGFAVLLRILAPCWTQALHPEIPARIISGLAVLTMVFANLAALRQTNLKRLLAYSSIAHAGYLLLAVRTGDAAGLMYYLTVYLFMNIGAFAAVISLGRKGKEYLELSEISGAGFRYPWIGAGLSIFLLSLAGLPPTGGFLAKFTIFSEAVRQGHLGLVIVAVLASLVSVYYYLRVIVFLYMRPQENELVIETYNPALFMALFFCIYGVLQLGVFPGNVLIAARQAAASLGLF
jgi:NADH-quinone oxidoreductase subunit N